VHDTDVAEVEPERQRLEPVQVVGPPCAGQLIKKTSPTGVVSQYGYDYAGRQVRESDGLGRVTTVAYNQFGDKISDSDLKPGTETGDEEASPKIWENMDDFKARAAKLSTDAETVLAQLPADAAGVGAALNTLGGNCGGCHQLYRIKKD